MSRSNSTTLDSNPYRYNRGITPLISTHGPNLYERMMMQRQILAQQQRDYQKKMLEQNYPFKYAIGHGIFLLALAVVEIALQIVMIINQYLEACYLLMLMQFIYMLFDVHQFFRITIIVRQLLQRLAPL